MATIDHRNRALDALRGIAALGVVFFHFGGKGDAPFAFVAGKYGVELFFLISGYVILMSAERKPSSPSFALARFWRLYPTFWLAIAYTLGVLFILGATMPSQPLIAIPFNMLMFPKFFGVEYIDGVYWTLEYELIFYAYVVMLLAIGRLSWCAWILTLCSAVTTLAYFTNLRGIAFEFSPVASSIVNRILFLLLDGKAHLFLLGILAYMAKNQRFTGVHWICVAVALAGIHGDERASYAVMTVVCAMFAWAVWGSARITIPSPLLWLGAISFPLYLIHMRAGKAMLAQFQENGLGWSSAFACAIAITLVAAECIRRIATPRLWWPLRRFVKFSPQKSRYSGEPDAPSMLRTSKSE